MKSLAVSEDVLLATSWSIKGERDVARRCERPHHVKDLVDGIASQHWFRRKRQPAGLNPGNIEDLINQP